MKRAYTAVVAIAAMFILSDTCVGQAGDREKKALKSWDDSLGEKGIQKTAMGSYVQGGETCVGDAKGFQLWRGSYRGVPIALYSCMFQFSSYFEAEHSAEYPKDTSGVSLIRVVLVAEAAARTHGSASTMGAGTVSGHRVAVAMKEYKAAEVDLAGLVPEPTRNPRGVEIGAATVRVEDGNDGVLRFQFSPLKRQQWDTIDLEQALKGYGLRGERTVKEPSFPKWTSKEFAKAILSAFGRLECNMERPYDNLPTGEAEELVAHPMWDDADAITAMVKEATTEQTIFLLNVIRSRANRDPWYLLRIQKATPAIMELSDHKDAGVRGLLCRLTDTPLWPRDIGILELLLRSRYPEVADCAIRRFYERRHIPKDMESVRKLAASTDEDVSFWPSRLLQLAEEGK